MNIKKMNESLNRILSKNITINESEYDNDQVCSICGNPYTGYGNNAWPVNDGRCCDDCNLTKVIPARIEKIRFNSQNKQQVNDDYDLYDESLNEDYDDESNIQPDEEVNDDIDAEVIPNNDILDAATKVMDAYQTANKWMDSIKEALYTDMNCVFFSSFVHELAHSFPGRFDEFGDILHTVNIKIPYPATEAIDSDPKNIDEVFEKLFILLDNIKNSLNDFIKVTDENNHGMAVAAENCLNDIEGEYPMLYRLRGEWKQCGGDNIKFDKYVNQYVKNKDDLLS